MRSCCSTYSLDFTPIWYVKSRGVDANSAHLSGPELHLMHPAWQESCERWIVPALCTISSTVFTQKPEKSWLNNSTTCFPTSKQACIWRNLSLLKTFSLNFKTETSWLAKKIFQVLHISLSNLNSVFFFLFHDLDFHYNQASLALEVAKSLRKCKLTIAA